MSELSDLIRFYEQEIEDLKRLIQKRIEDGDYDLAHHHHQAILQVKDTLCKLRDIQDPNRQRRKKLESLRRDNGSAYLKSIYKKHIDECYPERSTFYEDGQVIDELLYELIQGRIKHFSLLLDEKATLQIEFSFRSNWLDIILRATAPEKSHRHFFERFEKRLMKFGFSKTDQTFALRKQVIHIDQSILQLKIQLSPLIYDIRYYMGRDRDLRIVISE